MGPRVGAQGGAQGGRPRQGPKAGGQGRGPRQGAKAGAQGRGPGWGPKAGAQGGGPGWGRVVVHMREAREIDADGYIDDAEEGEVGRLAHQPRDEIVRDDEAAPRGEGRVEGVGPLLGRHV